MRPALATHRIGGWTAKGVLVLTLGCGAEDLPEHAEPRLEQQVWIPAAEGGEIVLEDGASLHLSPGALAADAEVTLSREACGGVFASSNFRSCLYQVTGASDLQRAFSLQVPGKVAAPDGTTGCLSRRGAPGWPCLIGPGAETTAGTESVATSRAFSFFAARAISVPVVDERVGDVAFEPCGGAIEGHWELVATTGTANQFFHYWRDPDPFAVCGPAERFEDRPFAATESVDVSPPEDAQAEGEAGLGGWHSTESHEVYVHTITTMSCLRRAGERCDAPCVRAGTLCECVSLKGSGIGQGGSNWSYAGRGLIRLGSVPHRYCVEGDRMTVEFEEELDGLYLRVYERRR